MCSSGPIDVPPHRYLAALLLTLGLLLTAFLPGRLVAQPSTDITYDLLVRGGTVVDGTGAPGRLADVLVHAGRIVAVGDLGGSEVRAARIVDASGLVVTAGFIDAHTHGDPLRTPFFENFISQGVTTIVVGQDGSSQSVARMAAWMERVDALVPTANVLTFIGHATIRREAGVPTGRAAEASERTRMEELVEEAMRLGCFGLSTGIEYVPGIFADRAELAAAARPVGRAGGIVMSHLRTEDDELVHGALDELVTQGRDSGARVHVSHIKVVYGKGTDRADELLARMEAARAAGVGITADIYPYTASYTGISIVFPEWALAPNDYGRVVAERRVELAAYLRNRVERRNGPGATLLGTGTWAGRTLAEVAAEMGKPFEDVLIDDIGPGGASGAYFVMDDALQTRLLQDPHIMIGSDGSPSMRHPRGWGSFARVLNHYVRETGALTLEQAVHKMSGLTAVTLGLEDRGTITPGNAADLLVFDPAGVRDTATWTDPFQPATGMQWVIVNGRVALERGEPTSERAGRMLRRR